MLPILAFALGTTSPTFPNANDEIIVTFDVSAATTYNVICLVGNGTTVEWPNDDNPEPDVKMTKSTFDEHIWFAQGIELSDGSVKFRANLSWDVNWGCGDNFPSGIANDENINAKAGTYDQRFHVLSGRYIFFPVIIAD